MSNKLTKEQADMVVAEFAQYYKDKNKPLKFTLKAIRLIMITCSEEDEECSKQLKIKKIW